MRAMRAMSGTLSTGAKVAYFLYTYKYNKQFNYAISACISAICKVFYMHKQRINE